MGRAGLHRTGPHRKPRVIGQDLHVTAEGPVPTGVPQVVAGLGASGDPVGADQGPVQADERLAVPAEPVQDVGDLGGSLGDHLQGLAGGSGSRWPARPRRRGPGSAISVPSLSHRSTRTAWPQVVQAR